MATQVQVPSLGESITQAILVRWHKQDGQSVAADEPICELETDKANVDVPAPIAGVIHRVKDEGATVSVGEVIASIDQGVAGVTPKAAVETLVSQPAKPATGAAGAKSDSASAPTSVAVSSVAKSSSPPAPAPQQAVPASAAGKQAGGVDPSAYSPAVRALLAEHKLDPSQIKATGVGGRLTKEDVVQFLGAGSASQPAAATRTVKAQPEEAETESAAPPASHQAVVSERITPATAASGSAPPKQLAIDFDASGERRVPMSKIRRRIAETLVHAQQTAAILTTFNEVDMTAIMELRNRYKESFQKMHNVGLGFMSFFAKAAVMGLREFPRVNAYMDGLDIVYHNYVHLGIAVSTERGLAVPVLRNVEGMSFARIEAEIKRLATNVRDGRLSLEELSGGTFTITNGGVFGSLLSTPIINPPQSGILGMHAIQKRAVVIGDKIEIRPMMYLALSYDHRLVDGRESVSFLVRLKQLLEDPARLMLEV